VRTYKAEVTFGNGKYTVKYPVPVEASSLPVAGYRAIKDGLKIWKGNGHRVAPSSVNVLLRPGAGG
jgi:hypothetical protein